MSDKLSRYTFMVLFFTGVFFLTPSAFGQAADDAVSVEFDRMWVDYNVTRGNEYGMIIHTRFTVYNLLGVSGYLTIRILGEDGEPLQSPTQGYRNETGDLAVFNKITPAYDAALYDDFEVFMPYREIRSGSGTRNLQIDADLIYENGDLIQHLTLYEFEFTGQEPSDAEPGDAVTVKFDRMWVDYDVTQNNEFGMLIHVSFSVKNMKGISGQLGYRFELENGESLMANTSSFADVSGQLTIYNSLTPAYDDTYYEDLQVFMPYREITVGAGSHNLRIHVDLLYENNGWTDEHLTYHNFTFTR